MQKLKTIQRMLRVDQAGEIGANYIYKGQLRILGEGDTVIKEMWEAEKKHLRVLNDFMPNNRVRPSALQPFWKVAGYALGAGTALLGRNAAMACTEAVETVIGQHYNDQLRELLAIQAERPDLKLESDKEFQALIQTLREFRDEELEHLETAKEHDAAKAPLYPILTQVIKAGCRVAIKIAEKV